MNYIKIFILLFGTSFAFLYIGIIFSFPPIGDAPGNSSSSELNNNNTSNSSEVSQYILDKTVLTIIYGHISAANNINGYKKYKKECGRENESSDEIDKTFHGDINCHLNRICHELELRKATPFTEFQIYNQKKIQDPEKGIIPFNNNPDNLNLPIIALKFGHLDLLKACITHLPTIATPNHPHNTYALKKCSRIICKQTEKFQKVSNSTDLSTFKDALTFHAKCLETQTKMIHFLGNYKE